MKKKSSKAKAFNPEGTESPALSGLYFIRYVYKDESGKSTVRFRDKKGKFVSAEKVKKSKKKVYDVDQRTKKIIVPQKREVKVYKKDFLPVVEFSTNIYAQTLSSNISSYLASGYTVGLKINNKVIKITKKEIDNVKEYQGVIIKEYMRIFGEFVEYPELSYGLSINEEKKKALFDLDEISYTDEDTIEDINEIDPRIGKEAIKFRTYCKRKANEYFKKEKGN
jgi:hypothetical protein